MLYIISISPQRLRICQRTGNDHAAIVVPVAVGGALLALLMAATTAAIIVRKHARWLHRSGECCFVQIKIRFACDERLSFIFHTIGMSPGCIDIRLAPTHRCVFIACFRPPQRGTFRHCQAVMTSIMLGAQYVRAAARLVIHTRRIG